MISIKNGWVTCRSFTTESKDDRVITIRQSEIIGIGETNSDNETLLVLKNGLYLTILESYEDFCIEFFTSE